MKFKGLKIEGAFSIALSVKTDERGWFARVFGEEEFKAIDHVEPFIQLNHSYNSTKGTIRGLHYQDGLDSETKMVRCIKGEVFDVVVDLRRNSNTYLQWNSEVLSDQNRKMLYIPPGCAHGFQTLTDDCELMYHHTRIYIPEQDKGIRYDDPRLNIEWPNKITIVSDRDNSLPYVSNDFTGLAI